MVTRSPEETEAAAARLARHVRSGDLLLLSGEMGSGKTTFVRGLARGMGVTGHVMSPTFQLVRIYGATSHPRGVSREQGVQLAHVDLFRITEIGELDDLGLNELLDQGAAVVEWGDRLLDASAIRVDLAVLDAGRRRLSLREAPSSWSW